MRSSTMSIKTASDGVLSLAVFALGASAAAGPDDRVIMLARLLPLWIAFYLVGLWLRQRRERRNPSTGSHRLTRGQRWFLEVLGCWAAFVILVVVAIESQHRALALLIGLPTSAALIALGEWRSPDPSVG